MLGVLKGAAKTVLGVQEHGIAELTAARLNTCQGCEHFNPKFQQCGVCGCFMDVKATLLTNRNPAAGRVEITHCPLGQWFDAHIANMYRAMDGKEPLRITQKHFNKWHTIS